MAVSPPREHPLWLKIPLNVSGPLGLGLALLGIVNIALGIIWTAVGALYVAWEIYPSAHRFVRRRSLMALPIFLLSGAVVGLIAWALMLKISPAPVGDIVGRVLIWDAQTEYYRTWGHNPVTELDRVNGALYVTLLNQSPRPIYLQGYSVQAEIDGTWVVFRNLPMLGAESSNIGVLRPNHQAIQRIDLTNNGFDYLMRHQPLTPDKPVEAWMFFNFDLSGNETSRVQQFKITLRDAAQKNHVIFSALPKNNQPEDELMMGQFHVLPDEPLPRNFWGH